MTDKTLLKKLGEETMYSAKGHFKSCDLRRNLVTATIWLCVVLSILDLMNIFQTDTWLDALGLFGAIALLIWNEGEGKDHKQMAESYLAIHKEIRLCYFQNECTGEQIKTLSDKVSKLDKSNKPDINWFARKWAQRAIEKHDETDNWWLS
jgi:hypothetical protein